MEACSGLQSSPQALKLASGHKVQEFPLSTIRHFVHGDCVAATATVASGPWNEGEPDDAMVPNPCGGQAGAWPLLRTTNTSALEAEPTAHESDLLRKRVHLRPGRVPGLLQLSVATFLPGAECEEHVHDTGTEVYLHFGGRGCHLRATEADGTRSEYDLYPHRFDALHPGTPHMAWNDANSSCENLNLMLADPDEVLRPK